MKKQKTQRNPLGGNSLPPKRQATLLKKLTERVEDEYDQENTYEE